jgi:SAM-dependent methyltransferase
MLQTIKAWIHNNFIFPRRVDTLASFIAASLPPQSKVLDIGSGNGLIAKKVMELRPDVSIQGVDVHKRDVEYIPVTLYDGQTLPFEDKQFDAALFVDVLHHTNNILQLLQEARRVSRQLVLIKDHLCESPRDRSVLSYMDDVGNTRFGVTIPQNYLSKSEWDKCFDGAALRITDWNERLHLYPIPIDYIFGGRLHFFGVLSTTFNA